MSNTTEKRVADLKPGDLVRRSHREHYRQVVSVEPVAPLTHGERSKSPMMLTLRDASGVGRSRHSPDQVMSTRGRTHKGSMRDLIEQIRNSGEGQFLPRSLVDTFVDSAYISGLLQGEGYEVVARSRKPGESAYVRTACGVTVCGNGYVYAASADWDDAWRPAPTA